MSDTTFDTIIIGGGTAGALLANRLSADGRYRVLLVEAGRKDDYHWIHIPVGYLYCIGNPRTDWLYHTEPDAGLNGRTLRYPRGKTLGGCSSINGMIYMRGQARDYDQWAELTGDASWRWENTLPHFRRHEDHWRLDQPGGVNENFKRLHGNKSTGSTGEWRVEKQRLRWDVLDAFAQAAQQAGIPATDDFNGGDNEGVGYFEVNQKSGWRWNTAKAFLRPTCYGRPNFEMWTSAQAAKLVVETQLLRQHGIDVAVDLPGVGANLQDHLQIRAVFKVNGVPTLNAMAGSLWGKAKIGLEYAMKRSGPMSMAPSQLGAFTRSSASQPYPNIEYHVQPLSLDAFGEPLHSFPAFTASVCNLNPTSRGTVNIKAPDFKAAPAIAPNYLSTPEDRQVAADSLRVTRRIVAQPALAAYQPEEWKPGVQFESDEDLARLAGDIATTIFHPVGTTKMGRDGDPMAVLDSQMRVRDPRGGPAAVVAGLRVVDAGAMPTITSGNTNSPTLMLAEKAAEWIVKARQAARQAA
ncbi:MAG: GMC family oxidoreductase [Acidovorax sp.]|nr:MAG: GMC family oxidoreductase [Acidovorax sp.]